MERQERSDYKSQIGRLVENVFDVYYRFVRRELKRRGIEIETRYGIPTFKSYNRLEID